MARTQIPDSILSSASMPTHAHCSLTSAPLCTLSYFRKRSYPILAPRTVGVIKFRHALTVESIHPVGVGRKLSGLEDEVTRQDPDLR